MPSIEMFHKYLCNVVLIATIKFYLNGAKIQGHNEFYIQDFPPPLYEVFRRGYEKSFLTLLLHQHVLIF